MSQERIPNESRSTRHLPTDVDRHGGIQQGVSKEENYSGLRLTGHLIEGKSKWVK